MADAARTDPLELRIRNLRRALENSRIIGKALGIVMERYGVDDTTAFETLRRVSGQEQVKLSFVAERLVRTGHLYRNDDPVEPEAPEG